MTLQDKYLLNQIPETEWTGKRRCGRPKQNWLYFSKKTAYEMHLNGSNYLESVEHDFRIYNAALNREF